MLPELNLELSLSQKFELKKFEQELKEMDPKVKDEIILSLVRQLYQKTNTVNTLIAAVMSNDS